MCEPRKARPPPDAVVHVARADPRGEIERVAEETPRRDRRRAKQLAFDVDHARRPVRLDHRRLAGDGDGLGERADLQIDIDRERQPGAHDEPFAPDRRKPLQLGRQGIGARRQIEQPVVRWNR